MDKKQLKKLIKSEFKNICNRYSFIANSDTLYLRVTNDNVIHIINFDLGSIGFTCSVAIQPLYTFEHTKSITLNMGERLSRFKTVQNEWWAYEQPENGINEIKELLMNNGMPWFEQYGSPKGIIDFISKGMHKEYGLVGFDPFHQKKYLGFSLLYTGNLNEGAKCIEDLIEEIKENAADFMILYKNRLVKFVENIKNQPDKIPEILNSVIIENKSVLKI